MNILIIPSAKLVNRELQNRYGKIVPILIPMKDKIVLDYIYEKYEEYYEEINIILYEEYKKTSEIIKSRNYPKIKIKKISKLYDIGYGIYTVLNDYTNIDIKNISINFGDTVVENILSKLNKDIFCYSKSLEIDRWASFKYENEQLVIKENNNLKTDIKKDRILTGFFNFLNKELLFKILSSKIKLNNGESLYRTMEEYNNHNKIFPVLEKDWIDFGHLDNFFKAEKIVETRFFNQITIDKNRNILMKTSSEKEKLINEIKWFLTLPNELQWVTPRIYSYSLEFDKPSVTMEYYAYPTLHHLYLYGNHNLDKWRQIFGRLFYVNKEISKYHLELSEEKLKKILNEIYLNKTLERFKKLKSDKNFSKYFIYNFTINNKLFVKLETVEKILEKIINQLQINKTNYLTIIHGDYFFANILYEPTTGIIKLIDPRGDFGGYGIYGDRYYDLAKLSHSVDGMYDFIVEDLFQLEESNNEFNYKILCSKQHQEIKNIFYSYFTKEEKIKIKFIQSLLFLSMIPLHKDKPKRQKVMLGVGMKLLYEILEEKKIKI